MRAKCVVHLDSVSGGCGVWGSRAAACDREQVCHDGASRATVTASDRSPSLRHTSAAASACSPASTKNVAANACLCLDMSAYAFFSAASLCRSSAKFLDKNSASLVSLAALKRPARTLVLPRAAYSSAHGFSPPGSRVAANSARAAVSTSRRSFPSSLTHSGTPSRRSSDHAQADSEDSSEDRSASCVSHCSAHASVSPLGPLLFAPRGSAWPPSRRARGGGHDEPSSSPIAPLYVAGEPSVHLRARVAPSA